MFFVACAFISYKPSWEPWWHIQVLEFLVYFELFCLEKSNFVLAWTHMHVHTRAHTCPTRVSQKLNRPSAIVFSGLTSVSCRCVHFPSTFMDVNLLLLWGFGWACSKSVGHIYADTFLGWLFFFSINCLPPKLSRVTLLRQRIYFTLKTRTNKQKPKPKQKKTSEKETQCHYKYGHCWRILQIVTWTLPLSLAYI